MDNTDVVLSLHNSSFTFTQCTGLEAGEPFGFDARFDVSYACFKSEDILDEVHDLDKTLLEGSPNEFIRKDLPNLNCNNVLPNPPDHSHVFPMCSLPSQSPEYYLDEPINNFLICDANIDLGYENNMFSMLGGSLDNYVSLGYFRGYDPSIDPYCVCLEDLPRKVMCTTIFNRSYDFHKAFDKVKRIFVVFGVIWL